MQAVVVAEVAEQEEEEREVLDMATRAHRAPISEQQRGIPAGKPQKAPPGANRKALGDIGNLVNAAKTRQEEAKPPLPITRPVTRSFGALLLKNAQSTAECAVNIKKPAKPEAAVGGAKAAAPPKQAKSNVPAAAEDVEKKAAESSLEKRKSSRKKAYSFSSVLSARSKAACGISLQQDEIIPSIDASDVGDPLKVVAYVEDIYQFYKDSEGACTLSDYMGSQIEINAKMRSILVDWLIEVHYKFELMPETLYLTVYIMDRFLSLESVLRRELQLVGMTALLIACKYEEIWAPEVHDFMCVSDNAYSRQQILCKEKKILEKLGWNLTVPTPYVFLVRFLKAASAASDSSEMENLTFFFAELGLMQYSSIIGHCPSMAAAAAVYAARCTMKKSPLWTEELKRHTGFAEEEVREKARALVELHQAAPESKLKSTFKKYSSQNLGSVASFPVAKQLTERRSSSSCSS